MALEGSDQFRAPPPSFKGEIEGNKMTPLNILTMMVWSVIQNP